MQCRSARSPIDHSHAVGCYEGPLREAIHRLKYGGRTALAGPLGTMLADAVIAGRKGDGQPADAIVPVPLHWWRARMRGFNQSHLLAEAASERLGISIAHRALRRIRYTPPQIQLASADREVNVQGAFAAGEVTALTGKHVLIVDDVMTTMATVTECARVLRACGVQTITVAAVARATRG
ncbi:MAG: ComF family protein [Armatimonadetes bacterium]|nr:ComF family protein [Armatimonadota bacterium]MDE2207460.1 ComF family protein [Armatimonadota bacterium]